MLILAMSSCENSPNEIRIGTQTWMTENLNVESFRNGDLIPEAKTKDEWKKAGEEGKPAWCYYQNDPDNGKKYGKLYNWHAVNDSRGLAPEGWSIPSLADYNLLEEEVRKIKDIYGDINKSAGNKLKSKEGWEKNNGTNESNFNALPGGIRDGFNFWGAGEKGFWWTSTEYYGRTARYVKLYSEKRNLRDDYASMFCGFSVRCIKGINPKEKNFFHK